MLSKFLPMLKGKSKEGNLEGLTLQDYYIEILDKVSLEKGITKEQILEESLKLYCNSNNITNIKVSEQELLLQRFLEDLETFLLENLKESAPEYKFIANWCTVMEDRTLSNTVLDYQLRKIVEILYLKPKFASKKFIQDLKLDRREVQTLIINIIDKNFKQGE